MTSNESKDKVFVQKINAEALQYNNQLEQKWKQFKQEYEILHTCLENFPKELSAPILMPLGSKVFVRAQLCNTNEVFIRYDDVFTKQTAYEAKAVCERNIKRCEGMIENLTKEQRFLSDNFCARQEIIADSEQVQEIIEPYDEEEFTAWKKIHKQREKEYRQQLKNKDIKNEDKKVLIENEVEEINKIIDPPRNKHLANCDSFEILLMHGTTNDDSDDSSTLTNESYDDEDMDDDDDDDDDDDIDDEVDTDDDDDEDSKLEIVFTNDVPETTRNFKKKIKKKVSFNSDVLIKEFESVPEEHFIRRREETIQEIEKPEILVTEIDDIVERVYDTCLENKTEDEEENTRPISRFKANRNKNKKCK